MRALLAKGRIDLAEVAAVATISGEHEPELCAEMLRAKISMLGDA